MHFENPTLRYTLIDFLCEATHDILYVGWYIVYILLTAYQQNQWYGFFRWTYKLWQKEPCREIVATIQQFRMCEMGELGLRWHEMH